MRFVGTVGNFIPVHVDKAPEVGSLSPLVLLPEKERESTGFQVRQRERRIELHGL